MPNDTKVVLPIGVNGLNLRSSPAELRPGELVDSLNWQIDQAGSLVKRLGFAAWSAAAPGAIINLMTLTISGGASYYLAQCDDGHVYVTTDGSTWNSIDSGLGLAPVGWAQFLDKLYYGDGVHAPREWDGTTLTILADADVADVQTITVTGTPSSGAFKLLLLGGTTGDIAYNASASDVQTALEALDAVAPGDVVCTGGALPGTPIVCTFGGLLASRPVTVMTSPSNTFGGGTAPAVAVTHTAVGAAVVPKGNLMTVWRNRLWISGVGDHSRRVYWSAAADPTSFITKLNYVEFPDDTEVTAIAASQNVSASVDAADGVLVFSRQRMHRIYDGTDNVTGSLTGGANILVDTATGCVAPRTIAEVNGRVYFLSETGVYSTDGHGQARPESVLLDPLFRTFSWGDAAAFAGFAWNGRYYVAYTSAGQAANTRLLECYTDLPKLEGQHPWMAHDVPVAAAVVTFDSTGPQIYFADASPDDGALVRRLFVGGYDADGDAGNRLNIVCRARTGAHYFGLQSPKRVRRADVFGRGNLTMTISADLSSATGEARTFDLRSVLRSWSVTDKWGVGVWGGGGGAKTKTAYYAQRGRFLTFELVESSQSTSSNNRALGYPGAASGGAAALQIILKLTPLDSD